MNSPFFEQLAASNEIKGVCGTKIFDSGKEGPSAGLLCMTHGNERAGVLALEGMFDDIRGIIRGKILIAMNNIEAAEKNVRSIEQDLNRVFSPSQLFAGNSKEARRARELLPAFDQMDIALDLHSVTSTPGSPSFTVIPGGTASQLQLAEKLSVDYQVLYPSFVNGTGSTSDYFAENGKACLTLEAGYEPEVDIEKYRENIRRYLTFAGVIDMDFLTPPQPKWYSLSQMERIGDLNTFQYDPSFCRKGFQPVRKGQRIATDAVREYTVNEEGVLLFSKKPEDYREGRVSIDEPFVYLAKSCIL